MKSLGRPPERGAGALGSSVPNGLGQFPGGFRRENVAYVRAVSAEELRCADVIDEADPRGTALKQIVVGAIGFERRHSGRDLFPIAGRPGSFKVDAVRNRGGDGRHGSGDDLEEGGTDESANRRPAFVLPAKTEP